MASSSTPQPEITGNESDLEDHISEEKEKPKRRLRKKVQKKKRTPEIKFDWPKKNYFDVKYGEIEPVVGIKIILWWCNINSVLFIWSLSLIDLCHSENTKY